MTRPYRQHLLASFATLLLAGLTVAAPSNHTVWLPQGKEAAPAKVVSAEQRMQLLIDEFIGVMPHNPNELRQEKVRLELAQKALPIMRRIRDYVASHKDSMLAQRSFEFTIYSLVLAEPDLRATIAKQYGEHDRKAQLLCSAADVIVAATSEQRRDAITRFAAALPCKAVEASLTTAPATALENTIMSCAVQCVAVAGDLSADEARLLAKHSDNKQVTQRLQDLATAAERDPKNLLNQPLEISGKLASGQQVSTRSLLGKVVLVEFWASWCGPCVKAMPELVALHQQHRERGLAIVGVNCDRKPADLAEFLKQHPEVDWQQLVPEAGQKWNAIATSLGVDSIPRLFLIDRQGVLRSVDAKEHLKELLDRYLTE